MGHTSGRPDVRLTEQDAFRDLLTEHWNEEEMRTMCSDLKIPYESLGGVGHVGKVREIIAWCERQGRVHELVEKAKAERPQFRPDIDRVVETVAGLPELPVIKYFVATSVPEAEIAERFKIASDRFMRVDQPRDADRIIFDLSRPPENWLRYVYLGSELPVFERIIFVALEGIAELHSKSVYDILVGSYGHKPKVCQNHDSLSDMLQIIEDAAMWEYRKSSYAGAVVAGVR